MISLESIKVMLTVAGVSRLKIDFDDERKLVNADYVFKGVPGTRRITYQEIINGFTIGLPEAPVGPIAAIAQELM